METQISLFLKEECAAAERARTSLGFTHRSKWTEITFLLFPAGSDVLNGR